MGQIYLRMCILRITVFMTGLLLNDMASAQWEAKMDEAIQVFRKLSTLSGVEDVPPVEDKIDEATQLMTKLNDFFVSELPTKNGTYRTKTEITPTPFLKKRIQLFKQHVFLKKNI